MKESIFIHVQQRDDNLKTIEVPLGISMSLMEVLKAEGEDIEATCGGIALCATCHIEVMSDNTLNEETDDELDMLESLPDFTDNSRLACQVKITEELDGLIVRLMDKVPAYS